MELLGLIGALRLLWLAGCLAVGLTLQNVAVMDGWCSIYEITKYTFTKFILHIKHGI